MCAPCIGGLEYMGRMTILSWLSTRAFSSGDAQTRENAPTRSPYRPMFCQTESAIVSQDDLTDMLTLANDWERATWWPSLTKWRTANAS